MKIGSASQSIVSSFEEAQLLNPPQSEVEGGINTLPFPFDDDILSYVSNPNEEEQDQHDLDIEVVPLDNLDLYPTPIPNQWPKPKWSQKLIQAVRDGARNPEDPLSE